MYWINGDSAVTTAHFEQVRRDLRQHHGLLQELLRVLEPSYVVERDLGGRVDNVALDHLNELEVDPPLFARELRVLLLLRAVPELDLLSLFARSFESAVFAARRLLRSSASASARWLVAPTAAWTRFALLVLTRCAPS